MSKYARGDKVVVVRAVVVVVLVVDVVVVLVVDVVVGLTPASRLQEPTNKKVPRNKDKKPIPEKDELTNNT